MYPGALKLREAGNSDSTRIRQLVFEVLAEYGLKPDPDSTDKDLDDLESNYTNRGGYFGVIQVAEQIVATLGIYRINETTCELRKMYVLSSQRGQGVGKQLLEFSLQKARDLGYDKIILETATPLIEAIALYKKYGFTEYNPENLSQRCDRAFELTL